MTHYFCFLFLQAEFRFYWLKSKFEENPEMVEGRGEDEYKFIHLPCVAACAAEIENIMSVEQPFSETMDGVLFFHKEAHYTPGISPLVVWLLPYMVPEVCKYNHRPVLNNLIVNNGTL